VPRELICIFNDHELELLISGLPDIDVGDLRANTEYTGFSPNSPVIQWFWQVVADMDKQDLALLLQFVTGGEVTLVQCVCCHGCSSAGGGGATAQLLHGDGVGESKGCSVHAGLRCTGLVLCRTTFVHSGK
jgi:hypothetical protein